MKYKEFLDDVLGMVGAVADPEAEVITVERQGSVDVWQRVKGVAIECGQVVIFVED